uniref:Complement component 1 Q subcomponent-binding protein, mitochondrial n=1 Tax=Schistosoma japonicum TaxID=6182 RepID=C1LQ99_SCHJA|nr:Complement component 1 Q subcomponent-binding protein, mitochondrial precursor [Schistosoma japonicum]CAX76880.1 Complement component 1 Q subcomponent-binding protein, mitochondrial precursor [Schistosoma japonicum]CAX76881.1 Complement component 1 Q subcomponent-binding protein, mitochondrial precursor [Schistosoma japonicum]CAX76885.1 Complement component 1 Q subcomponent-binding protein, mitochondrial precursor [Schistosoma japonicum]
MSRFVARVLCGTRLSFANTRIVGTYLLQKPNSVKPLTCTSRCFSSQVDRQFNQFLTNEIKQEKENSFSCSPPKGFHIVKSDGCEIVIRKEYNDGVLVDIEINLAGSVSPSASEDDVSNTERTTDEFPLEAHPDLRIKLTKPSGRAVIFNCSLPSRDVEKQLSDGDTSDLPTYSVDSVEMERVSGYFVYTDLFDDNMYDHTMQLLVERGLNADFQQELQNFCTSEEHKLYLKFLDEFQNYCKE